MAALYDDFETAYAQNHLVQLIRRHRPEVVIDCVNTATGLSYQDVFDGAAKVREWISDDGVNPDGIPDIEALLLSQTGPQIIRHVRFVHRATTEYATKDLLEGWNDWNGWNGPQHPLHPFRGQALSKIIGQERGCFWSHRFAVLAGQNAQMRPS